MDKKKKEKPLFSLYIKKKDTILLLNNLISIL